MKQIVAICAVLVLLSSCANNEFHVYYPKLPLIEEDVIVEGDGHYSIVNLNNTDVRVETLRAAGFTFSGVHLIKLKNQALDIDSITLKVDFYENGQFSKDISSVSTQIDQTDSIYLYTLYNPINETEAIWTTTIQTISEHSSGSGSSKAIHEELQSLLKQAHFISDIVAQKGEKAILGYISMNNSSSSSLGSNFDDNLANNEYLYVISCLIE